MLVLGFSVLYFFLSTGVMLFQTNCECLGQTNVSLFVASEMCDETISEHNCCSSESENKHGQPDKTDHSCGCDSPIISYLKLTNHLDKDSNFEYPMARIIGLLNIAVSETVEQLLPEKSVVHFTYYAPPENKKVGRDLINFIHQSKIAPLA